MQLSDWITRTIEYLFKYYLNLNDRLHEDKEFFSVKKKEYNDKTLMCIRQAVSKLDEIEIVGGSTLIFIGEMLH